MSAESLIDSLLRLSSRLFSDGAWEVAPIPKVIPLFSCAPKVVLLMISIYLSVREGYISDWFCFDGLSRSLTSNAESECFIINSFARNSTFKSLSDVDWFRVFIFIISCWGTGALYDWMKWEELAGWTGNYAYNFAISSVTLSMYVLNSWTLKVGGLSD